MSDAVKKRKTPPATSLAARENQLIALAVAAAEKRLADGSAPAQLIIHYLKLGSTINELEKEKLKTENELLRAKTDSLKSDQNMEQVYKEALASMKKYSGMHQEPEGYDDPDDE